MCVFFGEMSIQFFCPFLDWVVYFLMLSYMSCLYILEINPLSVVSFVNIFSHSECCLFIFVMVSSAVQKLLSLIRSHFLFVCLLLFSLFQEVGHKRSWLWFLSECFVYAFLKSFIVSSLTFRSLIHFSLFLCMVWRGTKESLDESARRE